MRLSFIFDLNSLSADHKMIKQTQTICWQQPTNCLSVFDHFAGLGWAKTFSVFVLRSEKIFGSKSLFFIKN